MSGWQWLRVTNIQNSGRQPTRIQGIEQGALSIFGGNSYVHEFMHDARHFLGFPCH